MFSGHVGREAEHDPLQVRYGSVVRNVQRRHLMNLELLLDKALALASSDAEQKRLAAAISEVLFKVCPTPSVGLVHRVLGLVWDHSAYPFMQSVKSLFESLFFAQNSHKHSIMLTHTSMLMRKERFELAKNVSDSYLKKEMFDTNPLLLAMAGHICYILGDASDNLDTEEEYKSLAMQRFTEALDNAEWHGFDEVVYLSVLLSVEQDDLEHGIEILEQNKERNPGSLSAARLFIEFAKDLKFGNERMLQACIDYAKLDSSNGSVIDMMMEILPELKEDDEYEQLCKDACDIVFDSLRFARKSATVPWYYLASFAASGKLFHHSSCFTDEFWQSVFLHVPKKLPQAVTQEKHTLSALKTYFCFHAYGGTSELFIKWATYTRLISPQSEEEPDDELGEEPGVDKPGDEPDGDMAGDKPGDEPSGDMAGDEPGEEPDGDMAGEEPGGNMAGDESGDEPGGNMAGVEPGDEPGGDMAGDESGDEPSGNMAGDKPGVEPGDEPDGDMAGEEPGGEEPSVEPGGDMAGFEPGVEPGEEPDGDMAGEEPGGNMAGDKPGEEPGGDMAGVEPGEEPGGDKPGDLPKLPELQDSLLDL